MVSEFEDYRSKRLEENAKEFIESKRDEDHIECPNCDSIAFLIKSDEMECLFCGTVCDFPDSNGEGQ